MVAAVTTCPCSPSSLSTRLSSIQPSNRPSFAPCFERVSVKIPLFNDPLSKRLAFFVNCHNPDSDSVAAADPTPSGSRPGWKSSTHLADDPGVQSTIDFLTLCQSLKTTKRKGWINHDIKGPESIADHMYRMSLMALLVGDLPDVNRERCIKIAIVHDIAEAIVGDITPSDGVPKPEKSRLERAALREMCEVLGGGTRAEEIKELWEEYENNSSIEANLVKDFDKVEMILQALEYETEHGKVLDGFFISTKGKFQTEIGKSWAAEILARRKSTVKNDLH